MIKPALSLLTLAGAGVVFAACGGVPGNAVATVDGEPIEKTDYTYYFNVAAKQSGQPKTAKEREALRNQVMQLLVSYRWIEGEAEAQHVTASDQEVKKSFDEQRKQSFPKDADYQKFLKTSGQSEPQLMKQVKLELLSNRIRDKVVKGKDSVSDAAIQDFYAKNKARFAQPEKRDLRVVLTKDKAAADKARAALRRGDSWTAVAKKYSIDDTSKAAGGKLPAQAKGTLDADLDKAVFSATKNELEGPVKTQYGYYVFTVTAITAPSQQTLTEAKETIKQTLAAQSQQKALDTFVKDFTKRWKDKTQCSDGYQTSDCKNGPKATPTPTATATR
jgi:foldase protein PrsA